MSIIKVNCPSCKSPLQIPEPKLRETQGRVVCRECQHIFRLVKKSKNQTAKPRTEVPPRPVFSEVGSMSDVPPAPHADPVWPNDDWPSAERPAAKEAAPQPKKKKAAQQRPNYRIPKAQDKPPRPPFADVGQQPFAFNLLDPQNANIQIPQVSVNPPAEEGTANPPALRPSNGEQQQNNITIHTGSLVFTLVGDGQNSSTTLTAPENNSSAPPQMAVQVPASMSAGTELNWVVATMVAFLVLILQLVYVNLMFL